jgi:CDP-paratose synthetase
LKNKILLTGATGFLGSHLLFTLINRGYEVVVLKRSSSDTWRIQHLANKYVSFDVDNQPLENVFQEQHFNFVIHTACHYGRDGSSLSEIVDSNLIFGLNLLEAAVRNKVDTFINTGTLLPRELNSYSLSKNQFVDWLKQQSAKIQVINLRLEHMYGPKDAPTKFIAWLVMKLKQNKAEIKLTSGLQKRDFIYIDDVVSAFLCILENVNNVNGYSEYEVGTGEAIEVKTFVENLKQVYEKMNGETTAHLNFGAVPYREGEVMLFQVNNQPLRNLGWKPRVSLQQGLEYSLKETQ